MKCICLIKLENLQCNLRSLENVNNEREMPHDDNRLGMFIFAASFVKNPDTYNHIKIIEMNYSTNYYSSDTIN